MRSVDLKGRPDNQVPLKAELLDQLGGPITRLPVVDGRRVKYVIRQSILYKLAVERNMEAAAGGQAFDLATVTLQDFLDHDAIRELVEDAIAFVAQDRTLADAKAAMDAVPRCQDVFVTRTGKPTEPVEGWLMNTDIAKHAQL